MKFEYDEHGITSYYFAASFYTIVLLPLTYLLWPHREVEEDKHKRSCCCDGCRWKRHILERDNPWKTRKRFTILVGLLVAWIIFAALIYKVSTIKMEVVEYDPYKVLNLDENASDNEIKRAYRQLSLQHHPDRGGDPKMFVTISKAYEALTDAETRKNWKEYNNPDGPTATQYGIALPKWVVEKQNSMWVLAAYVVVFMVILPIVVGTWWYRSIRMTVTQVLRDTTNTFFRFVVCYPSSDVPKLIKILSTASEFVREANAEIVVRPSDAEEVPALLREFPEALEDVKLRGQQQRQHIKTLFAYPPAQKAAVLIHAHLARHHLSQRTLALDKEYVIRKLPLLISELVSIMSEIMMAARGPQPMISPDREPKTRTIESLIKLEQMLVQAMWDYDSAILQLPHLTEGMLKDIFRNRRVIRRPLFYVASLPEADRRNLLRMLSDEAYQDVITVLGQLPYVTAETVVEVKDELDKHIITTGSVVTVTVILTRKTFSDRFWNTQDRTEDDSLASPDLADMNGGDHDDDAENNDEKAIDASKSATARPNQNKKKRGKAAKNKKNKQKQAAAKKKLKQAAANATRSAEDGENDSTQRNNESIKRREGDSERSSDDDTKVDSNEVAVAEGEGEANEDEDEIGEMVENVRAANSATADDEGSDDEAWQAVAARTRKRELAASKKRSFAVHCPYFPVERQEGWWVFVVDRKTNRIEAPPRRVTGLIDTEEIEFAIMAPREPGVCTYSVCVRSDSYIDLDVTLSLRFAVERGAEPEPRRTKRKRRSKKQQADDSATATESEEDDNGKQTKRNVGKRHDRAADSETESDDSDSELDSETDSENESAKRTETQKKRPNESDEDSISDYRDD